MKKPRYHRQQYVPTRQEHEKIEQAILTYPRRNKPETNIRDWAVFKTASLTGLRLNEVLSIQTHHIDWVRRIIIIPPEHAKNKTESFVWICDPLLKVLQNYFTNFKPKKWVFYNQSNNTEKQGRLDMCGYEFNWREYLKAAGLLEVKYVDKSGRPRYKITFHASTRTYFINSLLFVS